MKRTYVYGILIGIALITILITSAGFFNYSIYAKKEIHTSVQVVAKGVGINTDSDQLTFGRKSPGAMSSRFITVQYPQDTEVRVKIRGDMKSWLYVNESAFLLPANVTRTIEFKIIVPQDTIPNNYSGDISIYFLRP